ncbi:MAG: Gfo/Idh/MocA family oxidoreductase [Candidatus Lokiarchaeota archaeon]|nr:Gfo/Idh/MocA family oxidoreductase [Candidatus Lokiarchaeota archaeon]
MAEPLRVIIVGAGGHAMSWKAHVDAHPGWKLVGIVDTDTEKLEHATLWGVPEECAYPSIEDAARWSEDRIDAAIIATPIYTHHLLATQAIEQGWHVIVEKNMASTIDQAKAMVWLAREHPALCTAVGTQYRFRPLWWTIRQVVREEQAIGKLSFVQARSMAFSGTMRAGWRAWLEDIYTQDMMCHHVDVLRYSTGLEFVKIQAMIFKPAWSKWLGASSVAMNFIMAPRGEENNKDEWVHGQYHGDWQGTGLKSSWEDQFEFFGAKGSLRIEPSLEKQKTAWEPGPIMPLAGEAAASRLVLYLDNENGSNKETRLVEKRKDVQHHPKGYIDQMFMLDDMLRCIESRGKQQPATCFEEAYKSFLVTRLAVESSRAGRAIWVPGHWIEPVAEP